MLHKGVTLSSVSTVLVIDNEATRPSGSKIRFIERSLKMCCFNKISKHTLNY